MLEAIFSTLPEHPSASTKTPPAPVVKSSAPENTKKAEPLPPPTTAVSGAKRALRRKTVLPSTGGGVSAASTLAEEMATDVVEQAKSYVQGEKLNEPVNLKELDELWQGFLRKLDDRPALKAAMRKTPTVENHVLKLEVGSKIGAEEISKIKPKLLNHLKNKLRNSYLELHTEVVEIENVEGRPMTESEMFTDMKKKNPNLQKLINLLQLELTQ